MNFIKLNDKTLVTKDDKLILVDNVTKEFVTEEVEKLRDEIPTKLSQLEQDIAVGEGATEITYAELKNLRDEGKLVVGRNYIITDYECTTTTENTQSAGYQFDIIVVADSPNTLNEVARARLHKGDTYFAENNLGAWELKYCLDNDTNRFDWADEVNGKGVIYYMKDEHNNECPYDFKNIQFKRYKISSFTDNFKGNTTLQTLLKNSYVGNYDNDNNAVPENTILKDFKWFYTFTHSSSLSNTDASLSTMCYCNVIKPCYTKTTIISTIQTQILNDNVLIRRTTSSECIHSNIFEDNCFGNTLLSDNRMNHFSNYCRYNLLTDEVRYASFGYNNSYNVIGKNCYSTKFGNYCHRNIFGEGCYANTFGNNCSDNVLNDTCYSNTFGNECGSNKFGKESHSNIFGNNCYSNTFSNYCHSNKFDISCFSNTLGQWTSFVTLGNNCKNNQFEGSTLSVIFKSYCSNNLIPTHTRYFMLHTGVSFLVVRGTGVGSNDNFLQNIEIKSGVKGASTTNLKGLSLYRNQSVLTTIVAKGSIETEVEV